ncbi:MAG: GNAT family N-acetyltransferase [Proteobacteria bacterium]|nr:GNAT family N-acetyltransferase [Pseudomonadota bacterium]
MSKIHITQESPITDDGHTLINGSEAALRAVYSADECFTFTADELLDDKVSFFVARKNGVAMGCVALVNEVAYGEVKRLYVPDHARGLGIAKVLMAHLETQAKAQGFRYVKLETGDKLVAAVALYKSLGYDVCEKFGPYEDDPVSLFMEKAL